MLNIKDSLGFEWRDNGINAKGVPIRYKIHLFKCSICPNPVRSRKCYMKKHSGECKSCSSKRTIKIANTACKLRPFEARYNIFKHKCPETNLKYEDYLKFTSIKNCHYCDRNMPWQPYGENNPGFWLDRKSCNYGHIAGNLVVCCGLCNFTKRDAFTYEEFLLFAPILKSIRITRDIT